MIYGKDIVIGVADGAGFVFLYDLLRELSDNKFSSKDDNDRFLNLPLLAGIPEFHFDNEEKGGKK